MSEPFDDAGCRRRYLELVQRRPGQFANPPGDIYEILLDAERIALAQAEAEQRRRDEGLPAGDLRVGVLAEDPYLLVMRDAVRFADGSLGLYNRLLVPSGAAVLPVLGDSVVLLNRFRHGTRRWHLEAPRGSLSGTGTREAEARRELFEETGAQASTVVDLGELHSTTGCLDEVHQLYLARVAAIGTPDKHEAIAALETIPLDQFQAMLADGRITDGPTLALFLRARLRGLI